MSEIVTAEPDEKQDEQQQEDPRTIDESFMDGAAGNADDE